LTLPASCRLTITWPPHIAVTHACVPPTIAGTQPWKAVPQARSLEDPSLAGTIFTQQVDTRYSVTLSQMLPPWGSLRLRTAQAGAMAQAAMHAFEAERLNTFERVARAVMEYRYLEQSIAITTEQVDLMNDLQEIIAARYRSGGAEFPDWTQIRIEQERMQDRLAGLYDRRRFLSETLAALLHIQPDAPLPWIAAGTLEMPPPETLRFDDLLAMLEDLNPDLRVLDARLEAAEQGVLLAKRKGWPQPMVGLEWMQMANMPEGMEDSDLGLMAGITLPIWRNKYRAMTRQAEAQRDAIAEERKALYASVRADLAMATSQYQDTSRRLERYHASLIPQAKNAAQVARQAYAEGRMAFSGMIDAYRTLLDVRLMAARAEADRGIALADIGCCLGDPEMFIKE
jgi:outer membrane protein, heavy metal efflux system